MKFLKSFTLIVAFFSLCFVFSQARAEEQAAKNLRIVPAEVIEAGPAEGSAGEKLKMDETTKQALDQITNLALDAAKGDKKAKAKLDLACQHGCNRWLCGEKGNQFLLAKKCKSYCEKDDIKACLKQAGLK